MRSVANYVLLVALIVGAGTWTATRGQTGSCTYAGCLDTSFGTDGMAWTTLLAQGVQGMAVQSVNGQDRIVVIGNQGWTVARFLPSGSLDATFGTNGIITRTYKKGYPSSQQVVVQPDGKILVLGRLPIGPGPGTPSSELVVTRYAADGKSDDTTFGIRGTVTITPPPGARPFRAGDSRMVRQTDGKIVVAAAADADGDPYTAPFANLHVVRLTSAGGFDTDFGSNPQDAFSSFPNAGKPTSMVVQPVRVSENEFEERIVLSVAIQVSYQSDDLPYHVTAVRRLTSGNGLDSDCNIAIIAML